MEIGKNYNSLFLKAFANKELGSFAIGKGSYFIQDPERNEHWILGSWKYEILPVQDKTNIEKVLLEMFNCIMEGLLTFDKVKCILYHTHVMHALKKNDELNGPIDTNKIDSIVSDYLAKNIIHFNKEERTRINQMIKVIQKKGGLFDSSQKTF